MPDDDRLSGPIQESILTALCFKNGKAAVLPTLVSAEHFDGPYRDIASRVLGYRAQFGEAPNSHTDDIFADVLDDKSHQRYELYRRILIGMHEQQDHLNLEFVISRTRDFVRLQTIKSGIIEAGERLQQGGDETADEVEKILFNTARTQFTQMDFGTFLNEDAAMDFADQDDVDHAFTGIPELDRVGFTPKRGEMFLFIAPRKRGKTWFATHIGKMAAHIGWRVLHVSLEVSRNVMMKRYFQTELGIANRDDPFPRTEIEVNDKGQMVDLNRILITPERSFLVKGNRDQKTIDYIKERHKDMRDLGRIHVQQFPTGQLTVAKLESYLDGLFAVHNWTPDLLIVDYPDLMYYDTNNARLALGRIYIDLRGLAVRRNLALVVPTQGNRATEEKSKVLSSDIAEDISKVATADYCLTFSQTELEHQYGVARLYAEHSRTDIDHFYVLISQSYPTGQFVIQSAQMDYVVYNEVLKSKGKP